MEGEKKEVIIRNVYLSISRFTLREILRQDVKKGNRFSLTALAHLPASSYSKETLSSLFPSFFWIYLQLSCAVCECLSASIS